MNQTSRNEPPHVLLVVPRGEAVRNFLYSETLPVLADKAKVTIMSVVEDESIIGRCRRYCERILPLPSYSARPWVSRLRVLIENAHDRWLWSEVAKNNWELRDRRAKENGKRIQRFLVKVAARCLAFRPVLELLTRVEQKAMLRGEGPDYFRKALEALQPDVVFNCSHIHGRAGELPLRVAAEMGIKTAGFIFSWDNLTSRSRIFVPYDFWLVWNEGMKRQLLEIYPDIREDDVFVTGTPQFDYHFDPKFELERSDLCRKVGLDPDRPFVLYTAGIDNHFFEEHRHVERVAEILDTMEIAPKPQLVVRTYVKGTSPEMKNLADKGLPGTMFPPVLWEEAWQTPMYEDLEIYSGLLRHCALGINAASTVSLELMMFDKPIINLDFDPPGSDLPWCLGFERHIRFDHFRPLAESGATMVARSVSDMEIMLRRGLENPDAEREKRLEFIHQFLGKGFGDGSGKRVATALLGICNIDLSEDLKPGRNLKSDTS